MKNRAKIYDPAEAHHLVMKVSVVSIVVNILLSVMKLLAGIIARSGAMISDAVHSASDRIQYDYRHHRYQSVEPEVRYGASIWA